MQWQCEPWKSRKKILDAAEEASRKDLQRWREIGDRFEASNRRMLTEVGVLPLFEELVEHRVVISNYFPVYEWKEETTLFGLVKTGKKVRIKVKNYTPAEFRISRGNDCRCEIDFDKWHEDRSYAADPMGGVISDYIPHWKRMIARVDRGLNLEMEVDGVLVERMRVENDLVGAVAAMLHKYRG